MRRSFLAFGWISFLAFTAGACSSDGSNGGSSTPGGGGSVGGAANSGGASSSAGGATGSGGVAPGSGGAAGSGGAPGSGGASTSGGGTSTGGSSSGGRDSGPVTGSGGGAGAAGGRRDAGPEAAGPVGTVDASSNITIWIAGDSTVADGASPCPIGWGAQFKPYFNSRVAITNSAVGGRSVRTWLYNVQTVMDSTGECVLTVDASGQPTLQARWQAMLNGMKAGDYLFIQFGINDGDPTCDRHVGLNAFKLSYGMMAQAAKDRGTQPIFLTPVSAIACTGSMARPTRGGYVTATQEAGVQYGVPVIDLHGLSIALYTSLGFCPLPGGVDVSAATTGPVGDFFCDDHTHFATPGAVQIAGLIAKALRDQNIGLAAYLQ
jgi:lysophospholipase L1-like esterase